MTCTAVTPSDKVCSWPAVANGDPTVDAWDTHAANFGPLRNLHCPKLDSGLSALLEDLDERGLLK